MQVATQTELAAAFTSAAAALTAGVPSGTQALGAAKSLIAVLPPPLRSYYNEIMSSELLIASSVVNDAGLATGGPPQGVRAAASGPSSGVSNIASAGGAAPTSIVKVAGVAVGLFGAAIAVL